MLVLKTAVFVSHSHMFTVVNKVDSSFPPLGKEFGRARSLEDASLKRKKMRRALHKFSCSSRNENCQDSLDTNIRTARLPNKNDQIN